MERRGIICRRKKRTETKRGRSTSLKETKADGGGGDRDTIDREVFEYKMCLGTLKPSSTDGVYLPEGVTAEFSSTGGWKGK